MNQCETLHRIINMPSVTAAAFPNTPPSVNPRSCVCLCLSVQNGKIDMTFFTHDCFHFTIKGHEELAKGLWNNMFQPEGGKMIVSSFSDPISLICPPMEHPYIFTRPIAAKSGKPQIQSDALSQAAAFLLLSLLVGLGCLGLL
ncbi:phospholipase B1, membrane-associated-like [Micropterus salmoides]|uniref:phospholipase B1, membrane-associated-like n=1 Tax=Micropterus salmoides TaxID=27706 RepID=UPI0018EBD3FA|nr:phospholipase B1, membrane-associated-like [Micropterus salmoides]